jgi:hypothetical protein
MTNEQFARLTELADKVSALHLMPMDTMTKEFSPCLVYGITRCVPNHILTEGIWGKGFVQEHYIIDDHKWSIPAPKDFEAQGWLPLPPTHVVG